MQWDVQREEPALPPPRIAWSKAQQAFVVVVSSCDSSPRTILSHQPVKNKTRSGLGIQCELDAFASFEEEGEADGIDQCITARKEVLDRILEEPGDTSGSSASALPNLVLLPAFITHWRRALEQMVTLEAGDTGATVRTITLRVCREFYHLAETALQLGDVGVARAALGRCIQLTRNHRGARESHELERDAKQLLLQCVQFQHGLTRCKTGVGRQHAPSGIVQSVLTQLTGLQEIAPFAVDVMTLRVRVLLSSQRFREVVGLLMAFAFTDTSASLTFAFATALEYEGFYQQSIAVATRFRAKATVEQQPEDAGTNAKTLARHATQLSALLAHKAAGDDALIQAHYEDAERAFAQALSMAKPQSRRLRAALLLGNANALLASERWQSARSALEESVRLDPGNQIARLRLRTVELSQETQQIQRRMMQQR